MAINYLDKIPNNVDLGSDRSLQRALEHWQPAFMEWWKGMGPTDFQSADVYLRTAVSVDAKGWADYGQVKMPDYRWGIFLTSGTTAERLALAMSTANRSGNRCRAICAQPCAA